LNSPVSRRSFLTLSGALLAAACGSGGEDAPTNSGTILDPNRAVTLRLGYFPNITHAQANVGLERGTFAEQLGANVKLEPKTFNAGPSVIEAMFAGALDASYIGPNPAINGFVQSQGKEVRVIAGATSGGALFVIRPDRGIAQAADFAGRKLATPQLGNTQDVALRAWLKSKGLKAREDGGNVQVLPTANADILTLFQKGDIDGAWVPEPWATRLTREAQGKVYLDERTLWPNGDFVTTHLMVRPRYLAANPDVVEKLVRAHVAITEYINANASEAKTLLNRAIEKATTAALPARVIDGAWENQRITYDPIAPSLKKSADDAYALGFLPQKPDLATIYDLTLLNKILREKQLSEVKGLG
jgi:NitT/TauT family transport system substrate-binding protein